MVGRTDRKDNELSVNTCWKDADVHVGMMCVNMAGLVSAKRLHFSNVHAHHVSCETSCSAEAFCLALQIGQKIKLATAGTR
jgi:hypothetical protein